jgi:6-pyruvoyltetrahydropterin/6-carboxytetrahydropterin synthase
MKVFLTRRYSFPASHRLFSESLSDAENAEIFGKCSNPHGHGHNYVLEVTVAGQVDSKTGMVCDLAGLDEFVKREVIEHYDHADLNHLPEFAGTIPTSENLGTEIFRRLRGFGPELYKIRLEETAKNSFEYAGGIDLPR